MELEVWCVGMDVKITKRWLAFGHLAQETNSESFNQTGRLKHWVFLLPSFLPDGTGELVRVGYFFTS